MPKTPVVHIAAGGQVGHLPAVGGVSVGEVGTHPVSGSPLSAWLCSPKMNVPSLEQFRADPNDSSYVVIPYFLVTSTPDSGSANMELHYVKVSVATKVSAQGSTPKWITRTIPLLQNIRALAPGDELLVDKASKRAQELVTGDAEPEGGAARRVGARPRGERAACRGGVRAHRPCPLAWAR